MNSKIAGLIGLCRKSGNLACGATATETAIKRKACYLVLIAGDCGESIRKKIVNLCTEYAVEYRIVETKMWLGTAAGLDGKAVMAVKSNDFAQGILKIM